MKILNKHKCGQGEIFLIFCLIIGAIGLAFAIHNCNTKSAQADNCEAFCGQAETTYIPSNEHNNAFCFCGNGETGVYSFNELNQVIPLAENTQ